MNLFSVATFVYGLFIIASGVYRYMVADSKNALWFGIVMGLLAISGFALYILKRIKTALVIHYLVVLFVGGFFINKIFGDLEGDSLARVLALVTFSIIIAVLSVRETILMKSSE